MDQILEQCPGTISTADDVGVFGRTEEEHNANLHQLMRAAQKHGLIFNGDKCMLGGKIGVGGSVLIWKRDIVDKERITTD